MSSNQYDVIIAGGGPAGTTAATLLAQYGHSVLLIERDEHPRFHIGESMLPMIEPVMDRLGIDWSQGNLRKGGAEFIDEATGRRTFFSFEGIYRTFQIERSVFDKKLFDNAIKHGVKAHQKEQVTSVQCTADEVQISTNKAQYQGRYFIDATGRNALMGKTQGSINKVNNLGKFALYKHYKLAKSPESDMVFAQGNVQVFLADIGWIWCIPLVGGRLSVGLVVQKDAPNDLKQDALFKHYINASARMKALLTGAEELSDVRVEADFSYLNKQRYGQRFACCGDAAGFLDPVFSSGFLFAVKTAELVADQLHEALLLGNEADPEIQNSGDEAYQRGFTTMYLMIERFYCTDIMQNLFFEQDRHPRIKKEIEAILAGDLWKEGNEFQKGLLAGRSRKN